MDDFKAHSATQSPEALAALSRKTEWQVTAWHSLCTHFLPVLCERYSEESPAPGLWIELSDGSTVHGWCLTVLDDGTRLCLLQDRRLVLVTGLHYAAWSYVIAFLKIDTMSYSVLDKLFQFLLPRVASATQYDRYYCFLSTLWDTEGMAARRSRVILPTH